ncbi:hypothetical protein SRHO_G00175750 [Serrasalmus rhombeus]
MADPPKYPTDVPHMSTITASNSSSVIAPQVVGSHVEGSVSNNIRVHFHGERNTSSPMSPTSDLERVRRLQAKFKENLRQKLETILEALPGQKVVLTTGIAGTGKTACVQKFVLDWAMGTANQDVDFMFVLPFSELNLLRDDEHSLHSLLCHFHPELKVLDPKIYEQCKVVFIFDGLNESKLDLDLKSRSMVHSNAEEETITSVDTLISVLIMGELAPSALIWITSRPGKAKELSECRPTDLVTDLQGFSDAQIEEYLRKKICGWDKANRIISHIRTTWTVHTMCHLPVFCWITATALERAYYDCESGDLPKTLTEVLTCYLIKRNQMLKTGSLSKADVELFNALGEMAFKHPRDSSVLTEDDFREHGIEPGEGAIKSELLAQIFLEVSSNFSPSKSYRFLHSSIQAYLAALSVLRSYSSYSINMLKPEIQWFPNNDTTSESSENEDQETCTRKQHQGTLWELLKVAVDSSLVSVKLQLHTSSDGELKHFLPFLLGLAFNCGQMLLGQLMGDNKQDQDSIQKAVRYIKHMLKTKEKELSHDQSINLLRSLAELRDYSFEEEMRMFMSSCGNAEEQLSVAQCSVLAHLVQMSGIVLEDMDVFRLSSSFQGQCRLVSVVRNCRKARVNCHQAMAVISALLSSNSHLEKLEFRHGCIEKYKNLVEAVKAPVFRLKELHFSHIHLLAKHESWVEVIRAALLGPHDQPCSFMLKDCNLSDDSCVVLASALQSTNSGLKVLDLSYNNLTDTGVKNIYQKLEHSKCELEKLRLSYCHKVTDKSCATLSKVLPHSHLKELHLDGLGHCNLTGDGCEVLASALSSDSSELRELDLSDNDLKDSGVKLLSAGLKSSHCKLEILRMSGCMITEEGCSSLASALCSNPCHLRELDLSYNHPGESGEKVLSARLEDPHCILETLNLRNCGEHRMKPGIRKYGSYFAKWEVSCEEDVQKWENHLVDSGFCGEQGKFYWQVKWTTEIDFGMKSKSSNRCYSFDRKYIPRLVGIRISQKPISHTMGIYLDWPAGTLSFYRILPNHVQKSIPKSDQLTHLYTFHDRFRNPLYPYVKLQTKSAMVSVQSLGPFSPN